MFLPQLSSTLPAQIPASTRAAPVHSLSGCQRRELECVTWNTDLKCEKYANLCSRFVANSMLTIDQQILHVIDID